MSCQDLFSARADLYAKHRPHYPAALLDHLASLAPARNLAWDCGTGNGQAAQGLAPHFHRVIATDPSASQLNRAARHQRITYLLASAESPPLAYESVDLVTIAQALHWFDLDPFYAAVRRVLRPRGVIAAWCYGLPEVTPDVDEALQRFYRQTTGPFWSAGRQWIDDCYRTIPFPFRELNGPPGFACLADWSLPDYLGYLGSWSAVEAYHKKHGEDPVSQVADTFSVAWGGPKLIRPIRWPIYMRIGRVDGR